MVLIVMATATFCHKLPHSRTVPYRKVIESFPMRRLFVCLVVGRANRSRIVLCFMRRLADVPLFDFYDLQCLGFYLNRFYYYFREGLHLSKIEKTFNNKLRIWPINLPELFTSRLVFITGKIPHKKIR